MSDQNDFPADPQGHTLSDSEKTMIVSSHLYVMKKGAKAFPAIPLTECDGVDSRVASNGKFMYFWWGGRLCVMDLEEVIRSVKFHAGEPKEKAKAKPKEDFQGDLF